MAGLNSTEIYELFKDTFHHDDVFITLLNREYIVYRIYNESRKKIPDVILHEFKIHSKLMQMPNRKVQIHIHVILQDDTWRILEYTFYSGESFLSDVQNLVKEMNGKIKEVDKIMLYGQTRKARYRKARFKKYHFE